MVDGELWMENISVKLEIYRYNGKKYLNDLTGSGKREWISLRFKGNWELNIYCL